MQVSVVPGGRQEEGSRSPAAGVKDGGKPVNMGVGINLDLLRQE